MQSVKDIGETRILGTGRGKMIFCILSMLSWKINCARLCFEKLSEEEFLAVNQMSHT
jgi:hypothetical protein